MKSVVALFALASVLFTPCSAAGPDGFRPLFNGRNLDGWEQHGGAGKYWAEDGVVVGRTMVGRGAAFLCTKEQYGDFVLEFEFKVSDKMNSGVQFRSQVFAHETSVEIAGKTKKIPADRVHGYQYEIDPSANANTGAIWDAGRRGWLFELNDNPAARQAFKKGEWNRARVECKGDHIQTWINGVKAADFRDAMTLKGIVALQIHDIGDGKKMAAGEEIRWRNIRLKEL